MGQKSVDFWPINKWQVFCLTMAALYDGWIQA